jgi:hypothetical protein
VVWVSLELVAVAHRVPRFPRLLVILVRNKAVGLKRVRIIKVGRPGAIAIISESLGLQLPVIGLAYAQTDLFEAFPDPGLGQRL